MSKKYPLFDNSNCVSCGICVQACALSCLQLSLKGKQGKYKNVFPEMIKTFECIGCGLCERSCPMNCIVMKEE